MESAITHRVTVMALQKNIGRQKGVISIGISGGYTVMAISKNFSGSIVMDAKGNVAIQTADNIGPTLDVFGASVSIPISYTHAPSLFDLEGTGYGVGGSITAPIDGVSVGISGDYTISPTSNGTYYGGTLAPTVGLSKGILGIAEVHASEGETNTVKSFNVYNMYYGISDNILKWAKN